MSVLRVARAADHRVVPWKNGRGFTTELAVDPVQATLATGFRWRLSAAAVAEDGPFSAFPGLLRTLVLLEGPRLELVVDGVEHVLAAPFALARFPGAATTSGRVPLGPVRDLNLMVDAGVPHRAEVVRGGGDLPERAGVAHLLVGLEGELRTAGLTFAPLEVAVVTGGAWEATGAVFVASIG